MNKIRICSYFIFFIYSTSIFSQELDWLKNSTSNNVFSTHSFYTSTQHNNDFYFAGDFWKDLTIDGNNIEVPLDSPNGFIIKMDEFGTASDLWHFESNDYVRINAMAVHPVSESLIVTGYFRENMRYNNEEWNATYYSHGFVMSIAPDGTLEWINEIEPQNELSFANGSGLAIDENGNIFAGFPAGGEVKIDDQSFLLEGETIGVIIAKFDVNGDLITAVTWQSKNFEGWIDIADMEIDIDNQLVIGGSVYGSIEVADSIFIFQQISHQSLLVMLDNDLSFQWLKTYPSSRCNIRDIHIDDNDIVLSLQYSGSVDIDGKILTGSGSWGDMAIISIEGNSELQWVKNYTLSENGGNSGVYGYAITTWNDQYYIGGIYQGDVVHDGSLILDNNPSGPSYQYPFIISMSKEGEFNAAFDFAGSSEPCRISTISANESHLLFGGDFYGQVSFGDSTINTVNSALFYGALAIDITGVEVVKDEKFLFEVYPTMSRDYVNLKVGLGIEKITLISSSGMLLKEFSGDTRNIDISEFPAGVYYLMADMNGQSTSTKVVKQ